MTKSRSTSHEPETVVLGKLSDFDKKLRLPLYSEMVAAGFPSPAQDYVENHIDLNELLIKHPSATYLVRVAGDSMIDAGINQDDLLVVDRALDAKHEDIVIAAFDGAFTCKQLLLEPEAKLKAYNASFSDIVLDVAQELEIFGVVSSVIKRFRF